MIKPLRDTKEISNYSFTEALVSIVMPLYNAEKTVQASITSVLKQTYEHFELIIVDDCSTDNGYEIASMMAK